MSDLYVALVSLRALFLFLMHVLLAKTENNEKILLDRNDIHEEHNLSKCHLDWTGQ